MPEPGSQLELNTVITLLTISALVSFSAKWIKLPYSIALVIVGLFIGVYKILPPVAMTPELILLIFLPALLFEASWNFDLKALKKDKVAIAVFSTIGVLVTMLVVAGILHLGAGLDWQTSLLFGSMISATDPISVIALFRKLGIEKRIAVILEGESLFNDATAVVLFRLILAIVLSGRAFSFSELSANFCIVAFGGALVGLFIGLFASYVTKYFDDHLPEIMLTMLSAYGSFLLAERLSVSPVLAVITTGIVIGNYGSRRYMSATTRIAVNSFWEYAAFVVNSLVFLLIGMQVNIDLLQKYFPFIAVAIAAVVAARFILIFGIAPLVSTKKLPIPAKWKLLLFWGGLRGALCMAMALSLPLDYPMREPLIVITFGVVLFTLLIPGLTMEPLVKLLKMRPGTSKDTQYQFIRGKIFLEREALQELDRLRSNEIISGKSFDLLSGELFSRLAIFEAQLDDLHQSDSAEQQNAPWQTQEARRHLLEIKRERLLHLFKEGSINEENLNQVRLELNQKLEELSLDKTTEASPKNKEEKRHPDTEVG